MKLRVKYYYNYRRWLDWFTNNYIHDEYVVQKKVFFFFWKMVYTYSHFKDKECCIKAMHNYIQQYEQENLAIKLDKEKAKSKKEVIYFDDLKNKEFKSKIGALSIISEDK